MPTRARQALVLGVICLGLLFTCLLSFLNVVLGPVAIVVGAAAMRVTRPGGPGRGKALIGILGGAVGTALALVLLLAVVLVPPPENSAAGRAAPTPTRTSPSSSRLPTATPTKAAPPPTVPDLLGQRYYEKGTDAALRKLGLKVKRVMLGGRQFFSISEYAVLKMEPRQGSAIRPGMAVTLTLGTMEQREFYAENRRMPRLVGLSSSEAGDRMFAIRDLVVTKEREDDSLPEYEDEVKSQSPPPGAPLTPGQRIRLVVHENVEVDHGGGGGSGDGDDRRKRRGGGGFNCPGTRWC